MIVDCAYCEALVHVNEVARHEEIDEVTGLSLAVIFANCPSCNRSLLLHEYPGFSGSSKRKVEQLRRVYPPPDREASYALPDNLRNTFNEAISCNKANCYTASIIMCRKTLEALCHHFLGQVGNLQKGLKQLKESGIIDEKLYEWSEQLRKNGNLAAHDLNPRLDCSDAYDVLDFTEALLDYAFVLHERFQNFKSRQASNMGVASEKIGE